MILADKIINLRKKFGWSQEELAEKLGVSRQSISKYEGAQSVPDLSKILKLSEIFGVTTDYLVKDELEEVELALDEEEEETPGIHKVSMELANEYMGKCKERALRLAIATMLSILSPICLIVLGAASELDGFFLSEDMACGIGGIVLFLLVTVAVVIFIQDDAKMKQYEFIHKGIIETEYGVSGMVKEKQTEYRETYNMYMVIGTVLCICSVIPIFVGAMFSGSDFLMGCMLGFLLLLIAVGVFFFVIADTKMSAMKELLEEGEFNRENKRMKQRIGSLGLAYWLVASAAFLAYSIETENWQNSWIILVVAGLLYPVYIIILKSRKK